MAHAFANYRRLRTHFAADVAQVAADLAAVAVRGFRPSGKGWLSVQLVPAADAGATVTGGAGAGGRLSPLAGSVRAAHRPSSVDR